MFSNWMQALIFIATPVAIGAVGVRLVHRFFSTDVLRRHNEIATPIHAAIGVVYAVLLAFVIVTVWEKHDDLDQAVSTEGNQITGLARDIAALPDPIRSQLRDELVSYTKTVMTYEWQMMSAGNIDGIRNESYEKIWKLVTSFVPQNDHERTWLGLIYNRLNKLADARNNRLVFTEQSVPGAIWALMFLCGLVEIVLSCFFGAENRRIHGMMVISLCFTIGLMLFVIAAIDQTFSGIVRVDPEALKHSLEALQRMS